MRTAMSLGKHNSQRGFSLVEMLISFALGLMVLLLMAQLFKSGMDTSFLINQRAENQQNMRAAMDLISKDVSMAGAGLPSGGIQLPINGGASLSRFGCNQPGTCYVTNFTYPNGNYMNAIIPNYQRGVQNNAAIPAATGQRNDSITVVYADLSFPLFQYKLPDAPAVGFALPVVNLVPNPVFNPPPPALNSAGGLQLGDLIMLSNNLGTAVGEVTNVTANSITFGPLDALNFNQNGGGVTNNIASITGGTNTYFYRIFVVTYFLQVPANGELPRLMRQVNGLNAVPVADNIINLQFAYDGYNANTNALDPNQPDPIGKNLPLNLIQKVNIRIMGQSILPGAKKSHSMYLANSVSARNMGYRNRYQ